jgi:transposase
MSNAATITLEAHEARIATAVAEHLDRIEYLEIQNEKLKHMLWGRRSEKQVIPPGVPFQSMLFTEAEVEVENPEAEEEQTDEKTKEKKKRGKSKPMIPADAPREVVDHELPEDEQVCDCCGKQLRDIGYEPSLRLQLIPAHYVAIEDRRHKYACSCKGAGVRSAPPAPNAFPKSRITEETRAHIVVQKFVDHVPYYRQSAILRRMGIEISDRTLCHYGIESADRLAPIIVAMRDELLASSNLQADETTLPVLKTEKAKPGAHRGYLWAYAEPRGTIVYDYCRGRGADHPRGFLEGYSGILQTDRYEGYKSLWQQESIIDIACWAHARRRFAEAMKTARRRAEPTFLLIQKLYGAEKRARERQLAPADRARLREEHSKPILDAIKRHLDKLVISERPTTSLGDAVSYALNHWSALERYVQHGEAEIDNNLLENSMRPVALGRKNYLFAGSEIGAEAAAILYSLTETCRRLGIHPNAYLVDVFRRLATIDRTEGDAIRALTPARWKAERESTLG